MTINGLMISKLGYKSLCFDNRLLVRIRICKSEVCSLWGFMLEMILPRNVESFLAVIESQVALVSFPLFLSNRQHSEYRFQPCFVQLALVIHVLNCECNYFTFRDTSDWPIEPSAVMACWVVWLAVFWYPHVVSVLVNLQAFGEITWIKFRGDDHVVKSESILLGMDVFEVWGFHSS